MNVEFALRKPLKKKGVVVQSIYILTPFVWDLMKHAKQSTHPGQLDKGQPARFVVPLPHSHPPSPHPQALGSLPFVMSGNFMDKRGNHISSMISD